MRTRRSTRRAQVLEVHAVVIGALLSALARLIHRRRRQMRLAASPACIRRVSPRAHTIPHTTAHTGTCSGAHTCARLPMSTCVTSHTHTAPLSHDTLVHTCAHAHAHSQTDRFTHRDGIPQERHDQDSRRHTHAHTYTHVLTHSCLHTHIHTSTHTDTQKNMRAHTHIHKRKHAPSTRKSIRRGIKGIEGREGGGEEDVNAQGLSDRKKW